MGDVPRPSSASFRSIVRSRAIRNSVVSRYERSPSRMSWKARSFASVTLLRDVPVAAIFISIRSRVARSSTANCLNMFAVSGLGRCSASFSNVLYASTVYWKTVLSCWLVRMAGVASITVIGSSGVGRRVSENLISDSRLPASLYFRYLQDYIAEQVRLARQAVRRFELFVRFVGRRRRQVI